MRRFLFSIGLALATLGVSAQTSPSTDAAAPKLAAASDNSLGVKSANIFQIAPDADADPKYKD